MLITHLRFFSLSLFSGVSCFSEPIRTLELLDDFLHLLFVQRRLSEHSFEDDEVAVVSGQDEYETKRCECLYSYEGMRIINT